MSVAVDQPHFVDRDDNRDRPAGMGDRHAVAVGVESLPFSESPWRMSASEMRPGVTRGPVAYGELASYLGLTGPGEFRLYLWDCHRGSLTRGQRYAKLVGETNPTTVTIPAGVLHAYRNIGSHAGPVFSLTPRFDVPPAAELRTASSAF